MGVQHGRAVADAVEFGVSPTNWRRVLAVVPLLRLDPGGADATAHRRSAPSRVDTEW